MAFGVGLYRLVRLDGSPHPVLDAPYDSIEAAISAARSWINGQGMHCSIAQKALGVEVMTNNGDWRTVSYPSQLLELG